MEFEGDNNATGGNNNQRPSNSIEEDEEERYKWLSRKKSLFESTKLDEEQK
jgi:hypothetical protein